MERDGYEADLNRLFIMNLETGEKRFVSKAFESNVDAFLWNKDSQSIYFIGVWHGETQIYNIDLAGNDKLTQLTDGMHDYASLALCGDKIIAKRHSMSMGDEIYAVNSARNGDAFAEAVQLTTENKQIYDQLEMGKVEARWMKTTDGKQMLTWVIYPPQFDPNKKYPVIEYIYQGPGDQYVPKTFRPYDWNMTSLAELGFIVVMVDGMGTSFRSRAFENVCYKNLKDAGLPDHIAWIKAAARKYPYMDVDRVGIYGCSAGGQESTNAVLLYPDFYKAAYSACGCHDNRMDKIWWNELWLGYPVGDQYKEGSNVENAHLLSRPLMLVVGELDDNVDPASTMQVVNALIKANKDFELVVIPGAHHTMGEDFGEHKRYDFFVRHLMQVNPPKWDEIK